MLCVLEMLTGLFKRVEAPQISRPGFSYSNCCLRRIKTPNWNYLEQMLIPELYCTDWTTGIMFGHSGKKSSSLFGINSLHRIVPSNILQGRTPWEGERDNNYNRSIHYTERNRKKG